MLQRVNIEQKLKQSQQKRASSEILAEINADYSISEHKIDFQGFSESKNSRKSINEFNIDLAESDRIFHINQIKEVCADYRLRFLDVKFFKAQVPSEALFQIEELQKIHKTSLEGLKIMAPSKLFKLENAHDPLLFAPMGNDYFYLIHKWGNDLHPLRKWLMKPFKCIENFVIFIVLLSVLITACLPLSYFTEEVTSAHYGLMFLFTFKSIVGVAIFYGIAMGKNFSEQIWNSKYYNA